MEQLLGWIGAIGVVLIAAWSLIKSSIAKDKKITELEYKEEKHEIKEAHKNDSPDDIIKRLKSKFGWREWDDKEDGQG